MPRGLVYRRPETDTKTCSKCKETKIFSKFNKHWRVCRDCRKLYNKKYNDAKKAEKEAKRGDEIAPKGLPDPENQQV